MAWGVAAASTANQAAAGRSAQEGQARELSPRAAEEVRLRLRAQRGWLTPESLVAIVGGGIGGLATALALQQAGLRARVYERDSGFDVRRQGYGLTLSTTNSALAALGLLDELRQRDVPSRSHFVFKSDGEILGYFGNAFSTLEDGGRALPDRGNLRVPRQVLRQMLLDRLAPGTVEWDHQLLEFAEHPPDNGGAGGGVTLTFASGKVVEAAALIGADGIHSVVRGRRRPAADPPGYLGVLAVVGITPVSHPLLHERGFYTLDGQMRMFTMPFSRAGDAQQTMWQLSMSLPEVEARSLAASGPAELLQELQCLCRDWHAPVPEMLRGTDPGSLWAAPLCDAQPPPAPKKGSSSAVTVLGDAAHPMGMFKGQGANTALADGVALARWLTQRPLRPALACFEREMIARAAPRVKASRTASNELHSPVVLATPHPFAGVRPELHGPLRTALREAQVGANMVADGTHESLLKLEQAVAAKVAALDGHTEHEERETIKKAKQAAVEPSAS